MIEDDEGAKSMESVDRNKFSEQLEKLFSDFELPDECLNNYNDRQDILKGLIAATLAQEITRIMVTMKPMNVSSLTDIDQKTLLLYWKTLSHHYRGGKFQRIFENGVSQLNKILPEETAPVIQQIQYAIEPILNDEMKQKTLSANLSIPFLGKIGLGSVRFSMTGSRVAVRKFQFRVFRLFTEWCIWSATLLGAVHWVFWTIFNSSYLAYLFQPATSLVLLILLLCSTAIAWVFFRKEGLILSKIELKFSRVLIRSLGWSVVGVGWIYWMLWTLSDLSETIQYLTPVMKLALPLYLVCGAIIGWVVGRISSNSLDDEDVE